jgi:ubiquinone/menaquinone biosynthesis C-methylase UbiE
MKLEYHILFKGSIMSTDPRKCSIRSAPCIIELVDSTSLWATPRVEIEHVHKVYDCVAEQWHSTRYKSWSRVSDFIRHACNQPGSLVGDIGCGNGKNIAACIDAGAHCIACDISLKLVEITQRESKECDAIGANALILPIKSNCLDCALCIAVLHHISTTERRIRVISEVMRTVRIGGEALFYAWALEQSESESRSGHRFVTSDVFVPFHLNDKYVSPLTPSQMVAHAVVDTVKRATVFQRFCHVFQKGELESLVIQIDNIQIKQSYYDRGNWAVIVLKVG